MSIFFTLLVFDIITYRLYYFIINKDQGALECIDWGSFVMKITQESDYALRIVYYFANQEASREGACIIAKDQDVPLRFALKILRKLNAASITKAYRGVSGGYALAKDSKDISYKDVIEAIEGDIFLNRCLANKTNCTRGAADKCDIHKKLLHIQKFLDEELDKARF